MLRVSFSSLGAARAAVTVLEAYGYSAEQLGQDVVTDCPPLLAVPAIHKRVGLSDVERVDLRAGTAAIEAPTGFRLTAVWRNRALRDAATA